MNQTETTDKNQILMALKENQIYIKIYATSGDRARKLYRVIEAALIACNESDMEWIYDQDMTDEGGDRP